MPTRTEPVQLTDDDIAILKRVIRREQDATSAYQAIETRARADVLDAHRAKTDVVNTLGDKYGFDALETWAFDHATGTMTPQPKG